MFDFLKIFHYFWLAISINSRIFLHKVKEVVDIGQIRIGLYCLGVYICRQKQLILFYLFYFFYILLNFVKILSTKYHLSIIIVYVSLLIFFFSFLFSSECQTFRNQTILHTFQHAERPETVYGKRAVTAEFHL